MNICEWDKSSWDNFVNESPEGTIFCKNCFLESYGLPVRYLKCLNGDEVVAGYAFAESADGIVRLPYQLYCGIIFKDLSGLSCYRQNEIVFSVLEEFAAYLFEHFNRVEITNHWDIVDMRPFDWYNYHEREKGYYQISVGYTSQLDISNPEDTSGYRKSRRQCLRISEKFGCVTKESQDIELLNCLHEVTFERQGITRTKEEACYLLNICENLIKAEKGKLFVTEFNQKPASISFFIYDRFRAYYLFGATDPESRRTESGTKNIFDAFCHLNRVVDCREVDFVGVNSPQRGAFKLSFGGKIVPYYHIKKILPR